MYVTVAISIIGFMTQTAFSEARPCTHMIVPKLTCPLFDRPRDGGQAGAPAGEKQEGPFWLMGHEGSDLHCGKGEPRRGRLEGPTAPMD